MKKQKVSKERAQMINSAIAYLRVKGYHQIRATHESFKAPRAVFRKASEAGFAPDMIAEKDFGSYLFEILDEQAMIDWDTKAEKWKVFDEYAQRKKGRFYLIVYSDTVEEVNERLREMDIEPGLIRITR